MNKIPKILEGKEIVPLSIWLKNMNWTHQLQYLDEVVAFYNTKFENDEPSDILLMFNGISCLNGNFSAFLIGKDQYVIKENEIIKRNIWLDDCNRVPIFKTIDSFINYLYDNYDIIQNKFTWKTN